MDLEEGRHVERRGANYFGIGGRFSARCERDWFKLFFQPRDTRLYAIYLFVFINNSLLMMNENTIAWRTEYREGRRIKFPRNSLYSISQD